MIDKFADLVVRYRWVFIVVFVLVTLFFAARLPKLEIDPEIKSMLPKDLPARINLDKIEEIFGGSEMIIVVFSADDILETQVLKRIKKISKQMRRVKAFDRVISAFTLKQIKGEAGQMMVDPAVRRIPTSASGREKLRNQLKDNEMVYGSVVSRDFKHAAVIGFLSFSATDEAALGQVNRVIADNPGPGEIAIGGMPFIRKTVADDMRSDLRKLLPGGILVMLIFLLVCFRQLRGVLLPGAVTLMAIVFAMGFLQILGWKVHIITIILPVFLIAVANNYGIHVVARYQEHNSAGSDLSSFELAKAGVRELFLPIVATGVTTGAGILSLMTHIVIPARQVGVLGAIGVMYALFGSLLFIPAMLAVLPRAKPIAGNRVDSETNGLWLEKILGKTAKIVTRYPKAIVGTVVVVAISFAVGIAFLVIDTDPINNYPKGSPVVEVTDIINRSFGGSTSIAAVAKGDIKDPSVMRQIDALEQHLAAHPNVDTTLSIAKVVREMNQIMHDGDPAYNRIPDTRDAIAQYFFLYSMSGDPDDFDKMVDYPYQHAQVVARVNQSSTSVATDVVRYVKDYISALRNNPFVIVGGFVELFSELVGHIVWGQVTSLLLSVLLVAMIVAIQFRSLYAAILSAIPLITALVLLFGLMGYMGIQLNVVTTMLSSVMIGVGIDYTIHFLWRYRTERQNGLDAANAIVKTLTTSGRGIVFNALSVTVGFAVLMVSAFLPVNFFGFLVLVSIIACLVGALVVLPAICLVVRPSFLEPR